MAIRSRRPMARPRQSFNWARIINNTGPLAGNVAAQAGVLMATFTLSPAGETVRRVRGTMLVRTLFANGFPHMRMVAYVGPEGLVAGSFLNPVNILEENSDLYMQVTEPEIVLLTAIESVYSVSYDVKAMRKVDEGAQLYFVFGTDAGVTDVVITLSVLSAAIAT